MSKSALIRNELGPYKATKLWNDIVRVFRTRMPIGRHWRQLRPYEDTFVASEAVDWLYEFLQHHHDTGTEISRSQVIKLLQKFHRNNYIEDVRGDKYNSELIEENNRLFRFVALSPIKTPQWPRFKSVTAGENATERENRLSAVQTKKMFEEMEPLSDAGSCGSGSLASQETRSSASAANQQSAATSALSCTQKTDSLWKTVLLERLRANLPQIDDTHSLTQRLAVLKHSHVKHNMTVLHKNGYVTGITRCQLPPSWVISAMRYLAKWPDDGGDSFPQYDGFEKDVLVMIKDYFESLRRPLTTFTLYPIIMEVYDLLNQYKPSPIEKTTNRVLYVSETTPNKYSRHGQCEDSSRQRHTLPDMLTRHTAPPRQDVMVVYDSTEHSEGDYHQLSAACSRPVSCYSDPIRASEAVQKRDGQTKKNSYWRLKQQSGGMTRSVSFSHLLGGSRVETAFVGDDAYTVYHNSHHRPASGCAPPLPRAQSVYGIDQGPAPNGPPSYSKVVLNRATSEYCIGPEARPLAKTKSLSPLYTSHQHGHPSIPHSQRQPAVRGSFDVPGRYQDTGSIRLNLHSTPTGVDESLSHGLFDSEYHRRLVECLQIILLFLPPSNRRTLHMLLKLLNKASSNEDLLLDSTMSNRRLSRSERVVSLFWRSIIRCEDETEMNSDSCTKLVKFLVANFEQILAVPEGVKSDIERRIVKSTVPQTPKVQATPLQNVTNVPTRGEQMRKHPGIPAKAKGTLGISTPTAQVYCERISNQQYKSHSEQVFESAMKELLKNIVEDVKMSLKEKNKRLKQFERTYPEIFSDVYPTADSVKKALDDAERIRPKIKQPLLSRPMNLLRKFR